MRSLGRRRTRAFVLVALSAAVGIIPLTPTVSASAGTLGVTSITTSPAMVPSFNSSIHYYAVRCAGSPTTQISTTGSGRVGIGGVSFTEPANVSAPLVAGQAVTVVSAGSAYTIRCLPADFPTYAATVTGNPQAQGYVVTLANTYTAVFDRNGVPVWWYKDTGAFDGQFIGPNAIGWWTATGTSPCGAGCGSGTVTVRTLSGKPLLSVGQAANANLPLTYTTFSPWVEESISASSTSLEPSTCRRGACRRRLPCWTASSSSSTLRVM